MSMLEVTDLVAGYGGDPIVNGASLHVAADEIVVIVGPNGAGKSTLVKALVGLVKIRSGKVMFNGENITGKTPEEIYGLRLAYVPQVRNVFTTLTIRENLEVMLPRGTRREHRAERLDAALELFPELLPRLDARATVLSGGERQMLAMARSLMVEPRLLIMDEPTAAVAPRLVSMIFERLVKICVAGYPILLVEQNARKALACSTRGYVLEGGRNAITAPAAELLASEEVGRLYLGGHVTPHAGVHGVE